MAQLDNGYDATGGETMGDSSALPAGEYTAALVKSERKEAKANNGNAYINCEFEVTTGQNQGRRFWTLLNLWNSNSQAVEIAQRELNSICNAVGKLQVGDTEELHGIPMMVKLSVKKDEGYGEKNEVKSYKPLNSAGAMNQGNQNTNQQGNAGGSSGPWKNNAA